MQCKSFLSNRVTCHLVIGLHCLDFKHEKFNFSIFSLSNSTHNKLEAREALLSMNQGSFHYKLRTSWMKTCPCIVGYCNTKKVNQSITYRVIVLPSWHC